jgi:cyclopropane fatty-acyl-phospholipid synthase-like methyltransferase
MRPVQAWARQNRIRYFLPSIQPSNRVLEIGSGDAWFRSAVESAVPVEYVTIDIEQPADIRGDIRDWRQLGLQAAYFDVIVAFEVVEHVDCFQECLALLRPGGLLLITTPVPHMDWLLKVVEALRLTQQRTSPHSNLVYLETVKGFVHEKARTPWGLGQWAVLRKPGP